MDLGWGMNTVIPQLWLYTIYYDIFKNYKVIMLKWNTKKKIITMYTDVYFPCFNKCSCPCVCCFLSICLSIIPCSRPMGWGNVYKIKSVKCEASYKQTYMLTLEFLSFFQHIPMLGFNPEFHSPHIPFPWFLTHPNLEEFPHLPSSSVNHKLDISFQEFWCNSQNFGHFDISSLFDWIYRP